MSESEKVIFYRIFAIFLAICLLLFPRNTISAETNDPVEPLKVFTSHASYPIEWWYLTGRISTNGQRPRDGFEGTFFRFDTSYHHPAGDPPSPWEPSQILSFHGAYSDWLRHRFRSTQLLSRTFRRAVSLKTDPLRIRLGPDRLEVLPDPGKPGVFHLRLVEQIGNHLLDFTLRGEGTPLREGPGGRLVTGPGTRDWAWYLSYPKLSVRGRVGRLDPGGNVHWKPVTGVAWFDHEWTGALLGNGQTGWIWLGARFSGNRTLMAFQMQRKNGPDRFQGGTYQSPGKKGFRTDWLDRGDVAFRIRSYWKSPHTGICYPSRLDVGVASLHETWRIRPLMDDQELTGHPDYWEGAVELRDPVSGRRAGEGYLELTGFPASKGSCP